MKLRVLFLLSLFFALPLFAAPRPNVLFIAVDDLRPELGCYGERHMVTPNLDKLAAQGRLFRNHYVQVPTCGASRYAMLTGRYPQQPAALGNGAFVLSPKTEPTEPFSLPMLFKRNGYETVSLGKITHSADGLQGDDKSANRNGEPELPFSWSRLWGPDGEWQDSWKAFFGYAGGKTRDRKTTPAFEGADVSDNGYPDGLIAEEAIKELQRLKEKPFFLAVGFYKPHLPFNAPKKYWNLYDPAKLPPAPFQKAPADADPRISLHKGGELFGQYTFDGVKATASDANSTRLRHAYFAAVSYADVALSASAREHYKTQYKGWLVDILRVPAYDADALETLILEAGAESIAAFIFEPVGGSSTGALEPPPGFLKRVRQLCDRHEILMISDEVLVGAGRTGTWSPLEPEGVVPDIQVLGKGIAAGFAPLAAVVAPTRIVDVFARGSGGLNHAQTFSHHAVSCAAGTATLRYIAEHDLVARCARMGEALHTKLQRLGKHPNVGFIRGRGLLAGIELVSATSRKPFPRSAHVAEELTRIAMQGGLVVWPNIGHADGKEGDLVLLAPPYIVTEAELDEMVTRLEAAITLTMEKVGTMTAHQELARSRG